MSSGPWEPSLGGPITLLVSYVEIYPEHPLVRLWGSLDEKRAEHERLRADMEAAACSLPRGLGLGGLGDWYLVEFGGQWHRCRLLTRPGLEQHSVFLLDEGRTVGPVTPQSLVRSPDHLLRLAPELVCCLLANVAPVDGQRWSPRAAELLHALRGKRLQGKVREVLQQMLVIEVAALSCQMQVLGLAQALPEQVYRQTCLPQLTYSCPAQEESSPPRNGVHEPPQGLDYFYPLLQTGGAEPVLITQVWDPQHVFCQLRSLSQEIQRLSDSMCHYYEATQTGQASAVPGLAGMLGKPCAARGADGRWHRALVRQIFPDRDMAQVIHVDYGRRELVPRGFLRPLQAEYFRMPVVTYPCALFGVSDGGNGCWSLKQMNELRALLLGQPMSARIEYFSTYERVYFVTLYGEGGLNLNSLFSMQTHCPSESLMERSPPQRNHGYLMLDAPPHSVDKQAEQASLISKVMETSPEPLSIEQGTKEMTSGKSGSRGPIPSDLKAAKKTFVQDSAFLVTRDLKINNFYDAVIDFIHHPSEFWLRAGAQESQQFNLMMRCLADYYSRLSKLDKIITQPQPGMICCVKLSTYYYRATVLGVNAKIVEVFCFDTGATELVDWYDVKELDKQFKEMPPFALKCCLADVLPQEKNWSPEAIDYFKKIVLDKGLVIQVLAKDNDTYVIELLDESRAGVKDISKLIANAGFGIYREFVTMPPSKTMHTNQHVPVKISSKDKQSGSGKILVKNENTNGPALKYSISPPLTRIDSPPQPSPTVSFKRNDHPAQAHSVKHNGHPTPKSSLAQTLQCNRPATRPTPKSSHTQLEHNDLPTPTSKALPIQPFKITDHSTQPVPKLGHSTVKQSFANKDIAPKPSLDLLTESAFEGQFFDIGSVLDVHVTYIDTPGLFWCQLDRMGNELSSLMKKIQYFCKNVKAPYQWNKSACLAKYIEDGKWYRAVITNAFPFDGVAPEGISSVNVIYVDFGNKEHVPINDLQSISRELLQFKMQAFKCSLYNKIQPIAEDPFFWDDKAIAAFQEFVAVNPVELKCTIYALASAKNNQFNVVDLTTPFHSACQYLTDGGFATSGNILETHLYLNSYYYSTHDIKIGSEEMVFVTHVEKPCEFYCQLERNSSTFEHLSSAVSLLGSSHKPSGRAEIDGLCLAKYVDGQWYRGMRRGTGNNQEVLFVDFGNKEKVLQSDICPVPNDAYEILQQPVQAIKCGLSDIPVISEQVAMWFEKTILGNTLKAVVVAKEMDGKLLVELYVGSVQINAQIKEKTDLLCVGEKSPGPAAHRHTNTREDTRWSPTCSNKADIREAVELESNEQIKSLSKTEERKVFKREFTLKPITTKKEGKYPQNGSFEGPLTKVHKLNDGKGSSSPPHLHELHSAQLAQERNNDVDVLHKLNDGKGSSSPPHLHELHSAQLAQERNNDVDVLPLSKLCNLPTKNVVAGHKAEVYVTHINSLLDFYVQFVEDDDQLASISEQLNESEHSARMLSENRMEAGDLICALFPEDNLWYRAVLKDKKTDGLYVQYIDYGNTSVIESSKTCMLAPTLSTFPPMSIQCSLGQLRQSNWTAEAIACFSQNTSEQLSCEFIEQHEDNWEVLLCDAQGLMINDLINDLVKPTNFEQTSSLNQVDLANEVNILSESVGSETSVEGHSFNDKVLNWKILDIGKTVAAYAVAVDGPDYFWCQCAESDLDILSAKLQEAGNVPEQTIDLSTFHHGDPCIVKSSEDEQWYRAFVREIAEDQLSVTFIDYGNEETVNKEAVREIPGELLALPVHAFPCCLWGFDAANGFWSSEGIEHFNEKAALETLDITVEEMRSSEVLGGPPLSIVKLECKGKNMNDEMMCFWYPNSSEACTETDESIVKENIDTSVEFSSLSFERSPNANITKELPEENRSCAHYIESSLYSFTEDHASLVDVLSSAEEIDASAVMPAEQVCFAKDLQDGMESSKPSASVGEVGDVFTFPRLPSMELKTADCFTKEQVEEHELCQPDIEAKSYSLQNEVCASHVSSSLETLGDPALVVEPELFEMRPEEIDASAVMPAEQVCFGKDLQDGMESSKPSASVGEVDDVFTFPRLPSTELKTADCFTKELVEEHELCQPDIETKSYSLQNEVCASHVSRSLETLGDPALVVEPELFEMRPAEIDASSVMPAEQVCFGKDLQDGMESSKPSASVGEVDDVFTFPRLPSMELKTADCFTKELVEEHELCQLNIETKSYSLQNEVCASRVSRSLETLGDPALVVEPELFEMRPTTICLTGDQLKEKSYSLKGVENTILLSPLHSFEPSVGNLCITKMVTENVCTTYFVSGSNSLTEEHFLPKQKDVLTTPASLKNLASAVILPPISYEHLSGNVSIDVHQRQENDNPIHNIVSSPGLLSKEKYDASKSEVHSASSVQGTDVATVPVSFSTELITESLADVVADALKGKHNFIQDHVPISEFAQQKITLHDKELNDFAFQTSESSETISRFDLFLECSSTTQNISSSDSSQQINALDPDTVLVQENENEPCATSETKHQNNLTQIAVFNQEVNFTSETRQVDREKLSESQLCAVTLDSCNVLESNMNNDEQRLLVQDVYSAELHLDHRLDEDIFKSYLPSHESQCNVTFEDAHLDHSEEPSTLNCGIEIPDVNVEELVICGSFPGQELQNEAIHSPGSDVDETEVDNIESDIYDMTTGTNNTPDITADAQSVHIEAEETEVDNIESDIYDMTPGTNNIPDITADAQSTHIEAEVLEIPGFSVEKRENSFGFPEQEPDGQAIISPGSDVKVTRYVNCKLLELQWRSIETEDDNIESDIYDMTPGTNNTPDITADAQSTAEVLEIPGFNVEERENSIGFPDQEPDETEVDNIESDIYDMTPGTNNIPDITSAAQSTHIEAEVLEIPGFSVEERDNSIEFPDQEPDDAAIRLGPAHGFLDGRAAGELFKESTRPPTADAAKRLGPAHDFPDDGRAAGDLCEEGSGPPTADASKDCPTQNPCMQDLQKNTDREVKSSSRSQEKPALFRKTYSIKSEE